MSRLVVKDTKLLKILVKHFNFIPLRQKGSHVRLSDGTRHVTIPMHNKELRQGTIIAILKQADVAKDEIVKYL